MSYIIDVQNKGFYLHIKVTGENSRQNVENYLNEIPKICDEHNIRVLLIEENLIGPGLPVFEIFEIINTGFEKVLKVIFTIAYVDTNVEHNNTSMKFAETVAINRGISIKIFPQVSEAQKWLENQFKKS